MTPHEYWTKLIHEFFLAGELDLKNRGLETLHEVVFEIEIKVLNLSHNKLASIP